MTCFVSCPDTLSFNVASAIGTAAAVQLAEPASWGATLAVRVKAGSPAVALGLADPRPNDVGQKPSVGANPKSRRPSSAAELSGASAAKR